MAMNFPSSPSVNDTYTYSGAVYRWDGAKWKNVGSSDLLSIKDYGGVANWNGSSGTSNTDALTSAIAAVSSTGGQVLIPRGSWYFNSLPAIPSNVQIIGQGMTATKLYVGSGSGFTVSSSLFCGVRDLAIYGTTGSPSDAITLSGDVGNFTLRSVLVLGMNSAVKVSAGSLTHVVFDDCCFSYNCNWHVDVANGVEINLLRFTNTRFEQNGDTAGGGFRAVGNSLATGSTEFVNCIFEGIVGSVAVECGNNCQISFHKCHFEGNAVSADRVNGSVSNGCDIHIGAGFGAVEVINCNFSAPYSTTSGFYNIRRDDGNVVLKASLNKVYAPAGKYPASYAGFIYSPLSKAGISLESNTFVANSQAIDFLAAAPAASSKNDLNVFPGCRSVEAIKRTVQTTNATPTVIYGGDYLSPYLATFSVISTVTCSNADGTVYGLFVIRDLYKIDSSFVATKLGSITETPVSSGGTLAVATVIQNGGYESVNVAIVVTGVAATTIRWVADIQLNWIG